jgi:hypothetical protein
VPPSGPTGGPGLVETTVSWLARRLTAGGQL